MTLAGVSGKTVMENAEAKRMIADMKRGHITGLIFSKLARLARNTKELLEFADFFRQHNVDMISLQEKIDTSIARRPPFLHHDCGNGAVGTGGNRGSREGFD